MNWSDSINDKNNYMDTFTSTCILKKENPLQVLSFIEKLSNEMKKDVVLLMVSYIFKEDKEIKKLLDKELSNDVQDLFIDSMKKKDKNIEGYISERVLLNIKLINRSKCLIEDRLYLRNLTQLVKNRWQVASVSLLTLIKSHQTFLINKIKLIIYCMMKKCWKRFQMCT